jgi:hypothetical protein
MRRPMTGTRRLVPLCGAGLRSVRDSRFRNGCPRKGIGLVWQSALLAALNKAVARAIREAGRCPGRAPHAPQFPAEGVRGFPLVPSADIADAGKRSRAGLQAVPDGNGVLVLRYLLEATSSLAVPLWLVSEDLSLPGRSRHRSGHRPHCPAAGRRISVDGRGTPLGHSQREFLIPLSFAPVGSRLSVSLAATGGTNGRRLSRRARRQRGWLLRLVRQRCGRIGRTTVVRLFRNPR